MSLITFAFRHPHVALPERHAGDRLDPAGSGDVARPGHGVWFRQPDIAIVRPRAQDAVDPLRPLGSRRCQAALRGGLLCPCRWRTTMSGSTMPRARRSCICRCARPSPTSIRSPAWARCIDPSGSRGRLVQGASFVGRAQPSPAAGEWVEAPVSRSQVLANTSARQAGWMGLSRAVVRDGARLKPKPAGLSGDRAGPAARRSGCSGEPDLFRRRDRRPTVQAGSRRG